MRAASLAFLAMALLLPAAHAQTAQTQFVFESVRIEGPIGPGESTAATVRAIRVCPMGAAILPAGTLVLDYASQNEAVAVTGAFQVPVEQHACFPDSRQELVFPLQLSARDHAPPGLVQETVQLRGLVSQSSPGHSDSTSATIGFLVPLKPAEHAADASGADVQESPILAPGLVLATLGALAARRRGA